MRAMDNKLLCTAFDGTRRIAAGPYAAVALALKSHIRVDPGASVLVFDDATGKQIDLDLSGSDEEVTTRLAKRFSAADAGAAGSMPRRPGRPKLGVVAREITLLPRHWEWLAEQPGGASVTLRRLVEEARRGGPTSQAKLRRLQER